MSSATVSNTTASNTTAFDIANASELPTLTGTNDQIGLHEIHIFLGPINPSEEEVSKYNATVVEWNTLHASEKGAHQMKACFLALVFRDVDGNETVVKVMQSARYIRSNNTETVVDQSHSDVKWFEERGFTVLREKIEAMAYGINEIPMTDTPPTGKYFEFHIKVGRKDTEKSCPIEAAEIESLQQVSRQFSQKFKIPVPLSYNENKNKLNADGQGHQRFLNVRFREGRTSAVAQTKQVEAAINATADFKVLKTISEYVWYDTYTDMDKGWIDYTPEELSKLFDTEPKA